MNNAIITKDKNELIKHELIKDGDTVYEYYLTESESTHVASFRLPLYSIEVKMIFDGKEDNLRLCDCFANRDKAERFFDKLVKNLATPYDLIYVFEDSVAV